MFRGLVGLSGVCLITTSILLDGAYARGAHSHLKLREYNCALCAVQLAAMTHCLFLDPKNNSSSVYISIFKTVVSFLQLTSLITATYDVAWPNSYHLFDFAAHNDSHLFGTIVRFWVRETRICNHRQNEILTLYPRKLMQIYTHSRPQFQE